MEKACIDVVIPVYRPEEKLEKLIFRLERQNLKIRRLYLIHTKDGKDLAHSKFLNGYDNIVLKEIEPEEFDHGGTRDRGIRMSDADYVLCMTQDAVPADPHLTERLLEAMKDERVAVSYARQIPGKDCGPIEHYTRIFNYPPKGVVKTKADLDTLGIKTYFCSNVCALYRRSIYEEQGGFEKKIIISEDMIYAAGCIRKGYKVAYAAEAKVVHSHNYTCRQQFRRNFDVAVSQMQHAELLGSVRSESEGIRLVISTMRYLLRHKQPFAIPSLIVQSGAKYAGYCMGKHYDRLPFWLIKRCTMNPKYWNE